MVSQGLDTTEQLSLSIRQVFLKRERGKVQWQSTSKKKKIKYLQVEKE